MRIVTVFLLILNVSILLTGVSAFGQQKVLKRPAMYNMPFDKASEALPGSSKSSKEGDTWVVFSDRANNQLYSDKACTATMGKSLDFMQPLYVVEQTAATVRVVDYSQADLSGTLKPTFNANAGWIKKENLLLWKTCLKTSDVNLPEFKGGVFNKKAMVLNIIRNDQTSYTPPEYFSSPSCNSSSSIDSALVYQINFVFKETDNAYLIGDIADINDIRKDALRIKGWVKRSQTTPWNHRLAIEVNWDKSAVSERKTKNIHSSIVQDLANLSSLATTSPSGTIYKEDADFYNSRAIGEVDRFPVLNIEKGGAMKVGVIGDLRSIDGKTISGTEFASIRHKIDQVASSMRNINIMFVIDASGSMIPYSDAIQKAINASMRELSKANNIFRFGAVLYRDASEGKSTGVTNEFRDLTTNYQSVSNFIKQYMVTTYNKCDPDPFDCMNYGIKRAVERFDPSPDESNFVILIGDVGNHSRTEFTDCTGKKQPDFTAVPESDLIDLLARKNVNLISYQVQHKTSSDMKAASDAFGTQIQSLMQGIAKKRMSDLTGEAPVDKPLARINSNTVAVDSLDGIISCFTKAPDGAQIQPMTFNQNLSECLNFINNSIENQISKISEYLNGKVNSEDIQQLSSFFGKLNKLGVTTDQRNIIISKNGQMYSTGYTKRNVAGLQSPMFQYVLLMSQAEVETIKRALERLVPVDAQSMTESEYRGQLSYAWTNILVDILGYFPEGDNEAIDTLSLYSLSAILTGWGGKKKFQEYRLTDVVDEVKFPPELLYEYLVDWCITKGHIQSIYDSQNLLNSEFFEDHKWTIFYEYMNKLSQGSKEEDPALLEKLKNNYKSYDAQYKSSTASFRIPTGTGNGTKYYWIDSRVFPHDASGGGDDDPIQRIYKPYKK